MKDILDKVVSGQNLSIEEAERAMDIIMSGEATDAQIACYLTALRMKGETIDEITGSAKGMRNKCTQLKSDHDLLEIVGTGGDKTNTFNVSTVSSIVCAANGTYVAKHGNRSVSSKCGSADCFEALGVKLDITKDQNEQVLNDTNICFMFAPVYHSAMRFVGPARKQMGIRTLFNILGPLANPAYATLQVMGVYTPELVEPLANVLKNLGIKRAMVVSGYDGMDEVSLCGKTKAAEIRNGEIKVYDIDPADYGIPYAKLEEIQGGDKEENKQIALDILNGEHGPKRDMVVLNSAVALYTVYEDKTMAECVELAKELIDSKKALEKLNEFAEATQKYA